MISFVLIISFLLHIVSFLAIYQLFKQIQQLKQTNSGEIIELLDVYLQEIKDENRLLQEELSSKAKEGEPPEVIQTARKTEEEPTNEYLPTEMQANDRVETSLQARILKLHNEGFQEAEIARKLNCGKTEAALIIKLHA
ncbi:hypothetical protein KFZ58_08950 [Virgibacillus sp. NKC19-16]|uniref:DUF6115 domain-containing protein n=1 Tax=Virgibacillus salidurans TaxID=2831673 RepID=UPI001F292F94|nr:hypothetical protein [Virgibacillus sp. NKC19-16]UJL47957.1 hypothetical protein KFZ58_08950 [Virgibacillus sp. NKC19-16]